MTGIFHTETKTFPKWVAVACIFLALLFAGLEATHVHGAANSESANGRPCAICLSAHAKAPIAAVTSVPVILTVGMVAIPYEIEATSIGTLLAAFIRPPPSH